MELVIFFQKSLKFDEYIDAPKIKWSRHKLNLEIIYFLQLPIIFWHLNLCIEISERSKFSITGAGHLESGHETLRQKQVANRLPETNKSPLKTGLKPKGNDCLPIINFLVLCLVQGG